LPTKKHETGRVQYRALFLRAESEISRLFFITVKIIFFACLFYSLKPMDEVHTNMHHQSARESCAHLPEKMSIRDAVHHKPRYRQKMTNTQQDRLPTV
jgi:hypothetical protein